MKIDMLLYNLVQLADESAACGVEGSVWGVHEGDAVKLAKMKEISS